MPPTDTGPGPAAGLAGSASAPLDDSCPLDAVDTVELLLSDDIRSFFPEGAGLDLFADVREVPGGTGDPGAPGGDRRDGRDGPDLLDDVADWGAVVTPVGTFRLAPVRIDRDLGLISHWMNDPAVAAFWDLAGPEDVTADHLRARLPADGRSLPCLGVLDSVPMSYFEIYRADLDPLARHYPARPHDTGVHVLIGGVAHRGRGIGSALLRAVSDLVLDHRARCSRVVAEPDLRNTPSVAAFLNGGFRFAAECDLPGKRAALMIRERALRELL
ncbi:GNAT family N-acetyltransferase [Streptomyces clavuligerus]|uniref:Lysine N-acyltransferase MbtK n=1 Tax=Streptomyces clavuligerus TaxID=1901 RepID=B5GW51_STRCL|nr:GNAT family N-acetyltransferase [Streptomyces clavuligerus]ANW17718.1 siderophore biosynthesis protein [Streptomyces clavuligerus]AXU12267.1 N-acetyltransferase [Streptomyces clavuligerus]EDY50547.1 rhizobactin siderophore biosynthesis protein rhbD [Streptomyces clavuligerus]EFG09752.1 Lysine N-acyltransferase mbtK [Streptomyces clavuligerus]MBY6302145.1 acetyltransferase [Streptomyces clavuligerus]